MSSGSAAEAKTGRFPLWVIAIIVGSIALSLPAILAGYWLDDYWRMDTAFHEVEGPLAYYDYLEWWIGTDSLHWWGHPDFMIRRLQPLGSLSLFFDFKVWGSNPIYGHLQSVLWFVLLLLGALRLLRTLLSLRAAHLALAIFALGEIHTMPLGWISARCHVMGGALSIWAVVYYLAWRQRGERRDLVLALLLLVLGLLTVEASIAVAAMLLAYELLGSTESRRQRALAFAPIALVGAAYLILHTVLGYGVHHATPAYINPVLEPGLYLANVVPGMLALLGVFSFGIPGFLRIMPGGIGYVPMVAGLIGAILLLGALLRARTRLDPAQRRQLKWLGLATILSIAPALASTMTEGREALLAGLAFAAVAGLSLRALLSMPRSWHRLAHVSLLCFGFFFLSPLMRVGQSASYIGMSKTQERIGKESRIDCAPGARAFLLNGDFPLGLYAPQLLGRHQGIDVASWDLLLDPQADIEVTRSDVDTLTISSAKTMIAEHLMLGYAMGVGEVFDRGEPRATILERSERGPTKIAFTIQHLDDRARTCLLYYGDGIIQPATIPALGETVTIPLEMSLVPPKQ